MSIEYALYIMQYGASAVQSLAICMLPPKKDCPAYTLFFHLWAFSCWETAIIPQQPRYPSTLPSLYQY